jgi:hypothetical protein
MKIELVGKDLSMERKKKQLDDMSIWKVIMVKDNLNGIWVWIYILVKLNF